MGGVTWTAGPGAEAVSQALLVRGLCSQRYAKRVSRTATSDTT